MFLPRFTPLPPYPVKGHWRLCGTCAAAMKLSCGVLQEAVADGGPSAQQKAPLKQSQKRSQKAAQRPTAGSRDTATDPVLDWIFNTNQPYHANDPGVPGKEHFLLPRLPPFGVQL